jgi:hypothetical protein
MCVCVMYDYESVYFFLLNKRFFCMPSRVCKFFLSSHVIEVFYLLFIYLLNKQSFYFVYECEYFLLK